MPPIFPVSFRRNAVSTAVVLRHASPKAPNRRPNRCGSQSAHQHRGAGTDFATNAQAGNVARSNSRGTSTSCGLRVKTQLAQNRSMLPAGPGTYVLVLRSSTTRTIFIGRLGKLPLRPGSYLYIGSAFGPGGLRARIWHHSHRAERPHWHIDYLRRHAQLEAVWYCGGAPDEHETADVIGRLPGAVVALPTKVREFGLRVRDAPVPVRGVTADTATGHAGLELQAQLGPPAPLKA